MTSYGKFGTVQASLKTGNFPRLHFADVGWRCIRCTCRWVQRVAGIPVHHDRMVNKFSGLLQLVYWDGTFGRFWNHFSFILALKLVSLLSKPHAVYAASFVCIIGPMKIALRVRVEVLNHLKLWTLGACGLRIAKCKIGCFVVSSKLGKFPVTGSGTEECLLSSAVLFFFFFF